jgi:hypothetical protein
MSEGQGNPGSSAGDGIAGEAPSFTFEFDPTAEDTLEFWRHSEQIDPLIGAHRLWVRRIWDWWTPFAALFSALLLIEILFLAAGANCFLAYPMTSAVIVAMWSLCFWPWWHAHKALRTSSHKALMAHMTGDGRDRYMLGLHRYHIGPGGIDAKFPHHDIMQRWSGIGRIVESPTQIILLRLNSQAFTLPRRIFASQQQIQEFLTATRTWLDQANAGDKAAIRDGLRGRDGACPACGYNLRDAACTQCPECGQAISMDTVVKGKGTSKST